ncbi:hypothetical protein GCM10009639_46900 [Kitasatospora putterlickiae]|uniref:Uncharacterized protein n=1 Tax=Kitasatospora putterlickiae TaxID=221725 RepID=A0ABN1YBY5_9ACTN
MSELLTDITAIAPYFTVAATAFGTQLAAEAAQRVATESADTGAGFFRRLFGRRSAEVGEVLDRHDLPEERVDGLLHGLGEDDRARLSEALLAWLRGPAADPPSAERLVEAVRTVTINSYGGNTVNAARIENSTFNFGTN